SASPNPFRCMTLTSVCSLTATNSDCLYEAFKATSETLPIRRKCLRELIGDIAYQQEEFIHANHRLRDRDRIAQVTPSNFHCIGQLNRLGLFASQRPYLCSAPKQRLHHLAADRTSCTSLESSL